MSIERIFICDGKKECLLPSCKNDGQCRFTRDSTHAVPEMQINSTIEQIIISIIWATQGKDFTE